MLDDTNLRRPFDVKTLEEAGLAPTHDPIGTWAGNKRPARGDDNRSDIHSSMPGPQHDKSPLPTPGDPQAPAEDSINPSHYRKHPSGIECIEVTRHMNFNVGNAIKYLWRYMDKGDPIENLQKAHWYIDDEIRRLQGLR